jgi:hypothetical protein
MYSCAVLYYCVNFRSWIMLCLVSIAYLVLVLVSGDRELYRLGATQKAPYLRTEAESSLRNALNKKQVKHVNLSLCLTN